MPKLSIMPWSGRVQPGILSEVGSAGVVEEGSSDEPCELLTGLSSTYVEASSLHALDNPSPTSLMLRSGTQACNNTVASVAEDPARAFVLASSISERTAKLLILGPSSFAIRFWVSSSCFDADSSSESLRSIVSLAFFGSVGRSVHGGPNFAPSAVTACLASSWKALGNIARNVWLFSDVLVIAKIRFP